MIGEERQQKYMPLSNAVLPSSLRWVSYGLIAVLVVAILVSIRNFPEFLDNVSTGKIDPVHLWLDNWAWPIILLNIVFGAKYYPIKYVCAFVYLVAVLLLEIATGLLSLKTGLDISFMHWMQIILFSTLLLLMPILILKARKVQ